MVMIRNGNRSFMTVGFREALGKTLIELRTMRKHRLAVRKARKYRGQTGLKLNLGCGRNGKAGWINIDLTNKADLTLDLREPLPFDDDSCSMVYSEHFLEHLDYPEKVLFLLRECFRVLYAGGRISIGVPDTEWPLNEYSGQWQDGYFSKAKELWHPKWCETKVEHVNYHFRQGDEHRFAYDCETLCHVLKKAGFVDTRRRTFELELDSPERELGTLYVSAVKRA